MTKFLNISTDNTLGGSSASDEIVSSQKAIKGYVDGYALHNTSSYPEDGLKVLGGGTVSGHYSTILGVGANDGGYGGVTAIGYNSGRSSSYIQNATAIGSNAKVSGDGAIQIGAGTNSESCSLSIGFTDYNDTVVGNYKLLGSTGLIPIERLGGNSSSTDSKFLKEDGSWATVSGGGWTPPSQTGNAGKFLTTDGTDTSWAVAVKSVNNVSPVNGNVSLTIPTQASDISALDTNASNITSTGKETIVRLCLPDWSRAIAWTVGQNYTAPSDGYVLLKGNVVAYDLLDTDQTTEIQTEYWLSQSYTTTEFHPVAKGQYIKYRQGGQTYSAFKFIPFKGV